MFHTSINAISQALLLALWLNFSSFQSPLFGQQQKELIAETPAHIGSIIVGVAPYRFIVDWLSEKRLACFSIVPSESDPHHFEPTLSQVNDLRRADIALLIGEPCERQFLASLPQNHEISIIDLRATCSLLQAPSTCHHLDDAEKGISHFDLMDTHLWLSPRRLIDQTKAIQRALQQQYPAFEELFAKRGLELIQRLQKLDQMITHRLQNLSVKTLLVSHPALTYFCKDYGLEQLSAEVEGRHPSARQQTRLLSEIKKRKIRKILIIQPHGEKAAGQIAKHLNLEIDRLNPYGMNPIAFMEHLCTLLTR